MSSGGFGKPGAGADAAMGPEAFLDDRTGLHTNATTTLPILHSQTVGTTNLPWLTRKQRHEEMDQNMDRSLVLTPSAFKKGQGGRAACVGVRRVKAPRRSLSPQSLMAQL